jgi:hypothetical protein
VHGEWRQNANRQPNSDTLLLLREIRGAMGGSKDHELRERIASEIVRLEGGAAASHVLDSPLGVCPPGLPLKASSKVREVVELAVNQAARIKRMEDAIKPVLEWPSYVGMLGQRNVSLLTEALRES